jgi:hypothetical protein
MNALGKLSILVNIGTAEMIQLSRILSDPFDTAAFYYNFSPLVDGVSKKKKKRMYEHALVD